jgi:hypothetical protein
MKAGTLVGVLGGLDLLRRMEAWKVFTDPDYNKGTVDDTFRDIASTEGGKAGLMMDFASMFAALILHSAGMAQEQTTQAETKPILSQPELPPGYSWQRLEEVMAAFPKPDRWFFRYDRVRGGHYYYISREPCEGDDQFETGLSINVLPSLSERLGVSPEDIIIEMLIDKTMEAIDQPYIINDPPFITMRAFMKSSGVPNRATGNVAPDLRYYRDVTVNTQTRTGYLMTFETPPDLWDQDQEIARVMVDRRILHEGT